MLIATRLCHISNRLMIKKKTLNLELNNPHTFQSPRCRRGIHALKSSINLPFDNYNFFKRVNPFKQNLSFPCTNKTGVIPGAK